MNCCGGICEGRRRILLRLAYEKGHGVRQDDTQAVRWYRKAAKQGVSDAQFLLGYMYAFGRAVPKDDTQAVAWWRKAAEQGMSKAQFNARDILGFGAFLERNGARCLCLQGRPVRLAHLNRISAFGKLLSKFLGPAASVRKSEAG